MYWVCFQCVIFGWRSLSCLLEIWELPWEKDLALFSICSSEKQQKHVIKPAFIEFYKATISVIPGILGSLRGLGASLEEDEKHKKKVPVVYYNNTIIVTCSVWWGVTSPGLSVACSQGRVTCWGRPTPRLPARDDAIGGGSAVRTKPWYR